MIKAGPTAKEMWNWHPPLPLEGSPVFVFPPRPVKAVRWLLSVGFLWSFLVPYVATALLAWFVLQPDLVRCASFAPGWIAEIFARNLALMIVVAGGLHLWLHRYKRQGTAQRFDPHEMATSDPRFLGRSQVIDNMFWSCASGVTLWTAYEAGFMWGYANHLLPLLTWDNNPIWFALMFVTIPFWQSVHFYVIHRWLHWKPLYRRVHALHHRNVAIGPWSGISMHPFEQVLYFSSVLIHLVVASHPLHVIFHMQFLVLGAVQSHSGFPELRIGGKRIVALGDFFHQLHHRHFNCNYGTDYIQLDRLFGSLHDGTKAARAAGWRQ